MRTVAPAQRPATRRGVVAETPETCEDHNPQGYCVKGYRKIEVSWADRQLEKECSSDRAGTRRWGADQWKILRRRLASLLAAPSLKAMDGVPGRCHPLTGDRHGLFALLLWGPYRLVLEPDHAPLPTLVDGGLDTEAITRVRIVEVVDYHGG
jgi:proteic killer suppression protein